MKPKPAIHAAAAAFVLMAACSKPAPPQLVPRTARVVAVSPVAVQLELTLDVTNPNSFPLVVHAVDGKLKLGSTGAELGRAHSDLASSIPANATSSITSLVSVNWSNLGALTPLLLSPAPVPYVLDGTAAIGGDKLSVNLPFTLSGELTRTQLISAGLNGLAPR
jgi:LEA14-like dessication related protein